MPFPVFVINGQGRALIANRQARAVLRETLDRDPVVAEQQLACKGRGAADLDRARLCGSCWGAILRRVLDLREPLARTPCLIGGHPCGDEGLTRAVVSARAASLAGEDCFVVVLELPEQAATRAVSVCAYCQRVRVEGAVWHPLAAYLSESYALSLSHGICPTCIQQARLGHSQG